MLCKYYVACKQQNRPISQDRDDIVRFSWLWEILQNELSHKLKILFKNIFHYLIICCRIRGL